MHCTLLRVGSLAEGAKMAREWIEKRLKRGDER
jgi:hypothetical protein